MRNALLAHVSSRLFSIAEVQSRRRRDWVLPSSGPSGSIRELANKARVFPFLRFACPILTRVSK
jgi:hypothetical protein